jgi:hypothetical protein
MARAGQEDLIMDDPLAAIETKLATIMLFWLVGFSYRAWCRKPSTVEWWAAYGFVVGLIPVLMSPPWQRIWTIPFEAAGYTLLIFIAFPLLMGSIAMAGAMVGLHMLGLERGVLALRRFTPVASGSD